MGEQQSKKGQGSGAHESAAGARLPSGGWTFLPGAPVPPPVGVESQGTAEVSINAPSGSYPFVEPELDDEAASFMGIQSAADLSMVPLEGNNTNIGYGAPVPGATPPGAVAAAPGDSLLDVLEGYQPHRPAPVYRMPAPAPVDDDLMELSTIHVLSDYSAPSAPQPAAATAEAAEPVDMEFEPVGDESAELVGSEPAPAMADQAVASIEFDVVVADAEPVASAVAEPVVADASLSAAHGDDGGFSRDEPSVAIDVDWNATGEIQPEDIAAALKAVADRAAEAEAAVAAEQARAAAESPVAVPPPVFENPDPPALPEAGWTVPVAVSPVQRAPSAAVTAAADVVAEPAVEPAAEPEQQTENLTGLLFEVMAPDLASSHPIEPIGDADPTASTIPVGGDGPSPDQVAALIARTEAAALAALDAPAPAELEYEVGPFDTLNVAAAPSPSPAPEPPADPVHTYSAAAFALGAPAPSPTLSPAAPPEHVSAPAEPEWQVEDESVAASPSATPIVAPEAVHPEPDPEALEPDPLDAVAAAAELSDAHLPLTADPDSSSTDEQGYVADAVEDADLTPQASDEASHPAPPVPVADVRPAHSSGGFGTVPVSGVRRVPMPTGSNPAADGEPMLAAFGQEGASMAPLTIYAPVIEGGEPRGTHTWVTRFDLFRTQVQGLARTQRWKQLAAVTAHALMHSPWAIGANRTALLVDLARLYRDRLDDAAHAEEAFAALAREQPAHPEALAYLAEVSERRGDWRAVYAHYRRAVEGTWDVGERLQWTRHCATIARDRLDESSMVVDAWAHLWQLGDGLDEVATELASAYRIAGQWSQLAAFMAAQAASADPARSRLLRREEAEVLRFAAGDSAAAAEVLESLLAELPDDPIVLRHLAAIYAESGRIDALEGLARTDGEAILPDSGAFARLQLVADAVRESGHGARALPMLRTLRSADPSNPRFFAAIDTELARLGLFVEQVALLRDAAAGASGTEQADLLERAAAVAENDLKDPQLALDLMNARAAVVPLDASACATFVRLSRACGDTAQVSTYLQAWSERVSGRREALDVLRQQAAHAQAVVSSSDDARRLLSDLLARDGSDVDASEALIALSLGAGDVAAVTAELERRLAFSDSSARSRELARRLATHLHDLGAPPAARVDGWQRVLDYEPWDSVAIEALASALAESGAEREHLGVIEQIAARTTDPQRRLELALRVGEGHRDAGRLDLAAAACERALRIDPSSGAALDALVEVLVEAGESRRGIAVLESAADRAADDATRLELLRRALTLLPETASAERFALMRRIFLLGDRSDAAIAALEAEAGRAGAWEGFAAVLDRCASDAEPSQRAGWVRRLATVMVDHLSAPQRAFVALLSLHVQDDIDEVALQGLRSLATVIGRDHEFLGILDRLSTARFPLHQRKARAMEAARLSELAIGDPRRALRCVRWVLDLDPTDETALGEARRIASVNGFHVELDQLLTELGDRAVGLERRAALLAEREALARGPLNAPAVALALRLRQWWIAPEGGHEAPFVAEVTAQGAFRWALPSIEAAALSQGSSDTASLLALASRWETEGKHRDRALELARVAAALDPASTEALAMAVRVAEDAKAVGAHIGVLRRAAALSGVGSAGSLELLRRTAAAASRDVDSAGVVFEMHRRILEESPGELTALDAQTVRWRSSAQWWKLRETLQRRCAVSPGDPSMVEWLVEIGALSEEKLDDAWQAVQAWRQALALAPGRDDIRARVAVIVGRIDDPSLTQEWMRLELDRATGAEAEAQRCDLARFQAERVGDSVAALATLLDGFDAAVVGDARFAATIAALKRDGRWSEVADHSLARAQRDGLDPVSRRAALEAAREAMYRATDGSATVRESVLRGLLEFEPNSDRLLRSLGLEALAADDFASWTSIAEARAASITPAEQIAVTAFRARLALHAAAPDAAELSESRWNLLPWGAEARILAEVAEARRAGDTAAYVRARRAQLDLLEPREAALVLCHLAEVVDDQNPGAAEIAELYREARRLDTNCTPAAEALKGIGRRVRTLRPAAALLPEEGEATLCPPDRATRLAARAAGADDRVEWLTRAVATDPLNPDLWSQLADAVSASGPPEAALRARGLAVEAWHRRAAPQHDRCADEARALQALADTALAANDPVLAASAVELQVLVGHGTQEGLIAAADASRRAGSPDEALWLLAQVPALEAGSDAGVALALARGLALADSGRSAEAAAEVAAVLAVRPLEGRALAAQASIARSQGDAISEAVALLRTLAVTGAPSERAKHLLALGALLEDRLGLVDEGGTCFETAFEAGVSSRELLHRVFRHHQRTGQLDRGMEVVNGLLEGATEPEELASLWLARGQILLARGSSESEAVESFDMALSYDPGCQPARLGLADALERMGDWDQLLQVLEAVVDAGSDVQRAEALLRMATVAEQKVGSLDRAAEYLRASIEANPTRVAVERLESVLSERASGSPEHLELLGRRVSYGPPWYPLAVRYGSLLLQSAPRHAWCLLSPVLMIRGADEGLKTQLREMRRDYERPPLLALRPGDAAQAWGNPLEAALREIVTQIDSALTTCANSADEAGARDVSDVSPHSSIGRAFASLADAMGVRGVSLMRANELPGACAVWSDAGQTRVALRGDVFQSMARAEVGYTLAWAIEQARVGQRLVAGASRETRAALFAGLLGAVGIREATGLGAVWQIRLTGAFDAETLAAWGAQLAELAPQTDAASLASLYTNAVSRHARRVGLFAGADLYQVSRLIGRLEGGAERTGVFGTIEQFDEQIGHWDDTRDLVTFASSPTWTRWLAAAVDLTAG